MTAGINPSNEQPPDQDKYSILVEEDGVVGGTNFSSEIPDGYTEVDKDVWLDAQQKVGECFYIDGEIVDADGELSQLPSTDDDDE